MAIKTIQVVDCDVCSRAVGDLESFIEAMTYGVAAHVECFMNLNAIELVKFLGLDDIRIDHRDGTAVRVTTNEAKTYFKKVKDG